MNSISLSGVASVAAAALLYVPAAMAQPQSAAVQGAAPPPPAVGGSPMAGHPVPGKNAEERVEQRIKELHSQLQITPAEEPQWNEFAQVMRENARDMDQAFMQRAQQFPTMNAVQNMQSYEQISEQHAQRVQKLVPAFQSCTTLCPMRRSVWPIRYSAPMPRSTWSTRHNRIADSAIAKGAPEARFLLAPLRGSEFGDGYSQPEANRLFGGHRPQWRASARSGSRLAEVLLEQGPCARLEDAAARDCAGPSGARSNAGHDLSGICRDTAG